MKIISWDSQLWYNNELKEKKHNLDKGRRSGGIFRKNTNRLLKMMNETDIKYALEGQKSVLH